MRICTPRLEIRPCDDEAAIALTEIIADPAVYESFYLQGQPSDPARRILEPWGRRPPSERVTDWVACERGSGRVIGAVQLSTDNLGFFVSPDAWGRGYGGEMVLACRDKLAAHLGLRALEATVRRENIASRRILERAGFAFAGFRTEARPPLGVLTILSYRWSRDAERPANDHV